MSLFRLCGRGLVTSGYAGPDTLESVCALCQKTFFVVVMETSSSHSVGRLKPADARMLEKANAPEASRPPGRLWVGRESKKLKQLLAHPALQRERPWLFR
jgi:hypothetical protein